MLLPTEPLALEQKIDGINSAGLSVKVLSAAATSKAAAMFMCHASVHSSQGCLFNMYTHLSVAVQHFVLVSVAVLWGAWEGLDPLQTFSVPPPDVCLNDTKCHYYPHI